ncbi:MAG: PAS domain S-box protein, partial [bacterium]|nr:PAS domain S-box protein [bacterium]
EASKRTRRIWASHGIDLVQGGKGFLVYVPIFIGDRFDGFILGVFKVSRFIDVVMSNVESSMNFRILDESVELHQWQLPDERSDARFEARSSIAVPGFAWELVASPTRSFVSAHRSSGPLVILLGGLGFVTLLAIAVFLGRLAQLRARAVGAANEELAGEIEQRRVAQATLSESETRYRLLAANMSDVIWRTDIEGRISYLSPSASAAYGVPSEWLLGRLVQDILTPASFAVTMRHIAPLLRQDTKEAIFEVEHQVKGADPVWCEVAASVLYGLDGHADAIQGVTRIVEDRKRIEAERESQSSVIRLLLDVVAVAAESPSQEQALEGCLKAICQYTGWPVGHVYLVDEDLEECLRSTAIWHLDEPDGFATFREVTERTHFARGIGLPGRILEHKKPAWIEDVTADGNFPRARLGAIDVRGGFGLPVISAGKVLAVLEFFTTPASPPDAFLLEVAQRIGLQLGRVMGERAAALENERLRHERELILNSTAEGVYGLDTRGYTTFANSAAVRMLGYTLEEMVDHSQHELIHHSFPDGEPYPRETCSIYAALKQGQARSVSDEVFWRKDGSPFPVEYTSNPIYRDGEIAGAVVVFSDVTEQRLAEERFRLVVESSPSAMVMVDGAGTIVLVNAQTEQMFGYSRDELVGEPVEVLLPERFRSAHSVSRMMFVQASRSRPMGKSRDLFGLTKDGREIAIEIGLTPIDMQGETLILSAIIDVTDRKRLEAELLRLSHEDELTGALNRRSFEEIISREWAHSLRDGSPLALIMIDVDFFKAYNDRHGHQAGDRCLKEVARAIQSGLRRSLDALTRYGGEEFAAILPGTDAAGAKIVAENIQRAVRSAEIEHLDSLAASCVTVSSGVASLVAEAGSDPEELIKHADRALYAAKDAGRDRVMSWDDDLAARR